MSRSLKVKSHRALLLWRVAAAAVFIGVVMFPVTVSANNPCIPGTISTADPAPSGPFNDTLYLYCTQDANASLGIYNINCFGTTDLYHWINYGTILTENNVAWSNRAGHLWAPHVVYIGGRYNLYFPETASNGTFYNGHAYNTTSPHTTFTADAQQMLINGYRTGQQYTDNGLDQFCIMDTGTGGSGNNYLAWCITGITPNRNYIGLLNATADAVTGVPTQLRNADFYPDGGHYVEGQWWVKQNSMWYHIYACYYPGGTEQIGCATATTLTGTYTWRGWLMGTNINSAAGTIHPGCAYFHISPGQYVWTLFWHCGGEEFGGSLLSAGAMRSTGAEYFRFNITGTNPWTIVSPLSTGTNWSVPKTYRGIGVPKATDTIQMDRRSNLTATTYGIAGASISVVGGGEPSGHMVSGIGNNSWVRYDSVDFTPQTGIIGQVQARVASTNANNTIQVRLGSNTGTLLGTIAVPSTGSLTTWMTTMPANLTMMPPAGIQNLVLVFLGTANTMNVNWVRFIPVFPGINPAGSSASSAVLTCQRLNKNTFTVIGAAAPAEIRLFNMKGQEMLDAFNSKASEKDITVNLNTKAALSSGSYVLTVKSRNGDLRIPFVY